MEKLVSAGLVKSIGVSNFNSQQIQEVLDNCTIKPVTNQVKESFHKSIFEIGIAPTTAAFSVLFSVLNDSIANEIQKYVV